LRVIYVEGREGCLEKSWVKGVSKHLSAKKEYVTSYDRLSDDARRDSLITLRDTVERHELAVPGRYVKLVEELLDFSFKNASSGYVLALALAVETLVKK